MSLVAPPHCARDGSVTPGTSAPETRRKNCSSRAAGPPEERDWRSCGRERGWTTKAYAAALRLAGVVRCGDLRKVLRNRLRPVGEVLTASDQLCVVVRCWPVRVVCDPVILQEIAEVLVEGQDLGIRDLREIGVHRDPAVICEDGLIVFLQSDVNKVFG